MLRPFLLAALGLFAPLAAHAQEPEFGRHITPILYQLGCSAGTCHGAFAGKGGFRLSLFAGNNDADYRAIRGAFDRRLDTRQPEHSLLLLKPSGALPHGGGTRLKRDSWQYALLRQWIAAGTPYHPEREAKVLAVRVEPATFTLRKEPQGLRVFASLSTGIEEEVTRFTRFESLDPSVAEVDGAGQMTGRRCGDAAVLAHYAGQVAFATALVPRSGPAAATAPTETPADAVDRLLLERLRQLHIVAAPVCSDVEFVRRVYLDVIGQLPTPDEVRVFLADKTAARRAKVIDRLLAHPYHAALWAGQLCDMVGADDRFIGNGVYQFHDWFRNKLEQNMPWDRLAFGVVCATGADGRSADQVLADQKREADERKKLKGAKPAATPPPGQPAWHTGYAKRQTLDVFYNSLIHVQEIPGKPRIVDSRKLALRVAHTFLGVRLECAQCHKHPNDRWSQADFLSFAALFSHVGLGTDPALKAQKVNYSGVHVAEQPVETFLDPDTQAPLAPHVLGGPALALQPGDDPRGALWRWLSAKDNAYFARAIVNRVWAHYLGRGFVEPADAQAAANPPSHPEVLDELARDFTAHGYDLRRLHRRILNTRAYQRDWRTNATNAKDERNFSHRLLRRLSAEQALDAIAQVTGTPIKLPKRYAEPRKDQRAVEVALSRVGGDDGYVLQIFGRPIRVQNCDCERSPASSLSQTLYLFNDEKLLAKIAEGRLKTLVEKTPDDRKLIEELYLSALTRYPTPAEVERTRTHLRQASSRLEGYQDVLWSLMNRHDFVVNH